ncbi:metal ABC transporter ATP-binding protein [Mycolicibacterium thermoresistibile]
MTFAIEVADVTVRYGEVVALRDISARVRRGTVCGLIGMNGSGKSTLFKTIVGLVRPDTGRVLLDGDPPAVARKRGAISYVPQSEQIDWSFPLSIHDVVMTGRYGHQGFTRRPRAADRAAVAAALDRVGLTDLARRQIGQASGGQRKRAFVARAIAQEADILLLDEPFAGVDTRTETALIALLRQLAADGKTVLVSTHDLRSLSTLADEVILLMRRVLAQGDPETVLAPDNLARAFGQDVLSRR